MVKPLLDYSIIAKELLQVIVVPSQD